MAAFFTAEELMLHVQHTADGTLDEDTANLLADLASDVIRDDIRQQVNFVANEVITLYGDGGELIVLPERPVTAVTAVLLGGLALTTFDWRPNGALRRVVYPGSQYAGLSTMSWPFGVAVQVTYSHGFAVVPNSIKLAALELAAASYVNQEGLTSKTVDDVSMTWGSDSMNEYRSRLDRYRTVVDV